MCVCRMHLPAGSCCTSLVQAHLLSTTTLLAALPKYSLFQLAAAGALTTGAAAGSAGVTAASSSGTSTATATTTSTSLFAQSNNNNNDGDEGGSTGNDGSILSSSTKPAPSSQLGELKKINALFNQRMMMQLPAVPPRGRACILMGSAMALHFGGYEFARSAALALFTSSTTGFAHPAAYPFAMGLVTPVSLLLLYGYGVVLKRNGPRTALHHTTGGAVAVLTACTVLAHVLTPSVVTSSTAASASSWLSLLPFLSKLVVGALFVFQNSYAHLIYTQQWSFLGSVMTPTEGTKWFSAIAGLSSLVCTVSATLVHALAGQVGLFGLLMGTSLTLFVSMFLADEAYRLSEVNGFDPSPKIQATTTNKHGKAAAGEENKTGEDATISSSGNNKKEGDGAAATAQRDDETLLSKTKRLFQTSPTLAGMFAEVITFQSLSTVLNVCFVRQLKLSMPVDTDRASFTGQFYALVNGSSGLLQFLVLPLARKYLEPQWVYRFMPILLMPLLIYAALVVTVPGMPAIMTTAAAAAGGGSGALTAAAANAKGLWIAALAFFALKTLDYSVRNVANEMVYQPLDFDARYLGKEVIGVFANRFGKSGASMVLSALTSLFPATWGGRGTQALAQLSVGVGSIWSACSVWLSANVVTNKQAEERVQQRKAMMTQENDELTKQGDELTDASTEAKKRN